MSRPRSNLGELRRGGIALTPERVVDRLVLAFRWGVVALALAHLVLFQDGRALVLIATASTANALSPLARRLGGARVREATHLAQLSIDLFATVWLLHQLSDGGELLWSLLLLPVVEGAVRFRMRGALVTLAVAVLAVHATSAADLRSGVALQQQLTLVAVSAAIGLMSQQLEARLVELARSRAETDRRAELLSSVANAARTVTSLEPAKVLQAVTESALELGFDMSEICLADPVKEQLVPVVQRGWPEHHPPAAQPWASGVAGQAFQQGRTVIVEDYQTWAHALPLHLETGIARSAAAAPVRIGGETTAVLTVANHHPRELTSYERECLELLATQAGVALRNAQVHSERQEHQRELEHQATHDPLTQLANRSAFVAALRTRLSDQADASASVMFIDLDGFKQINDTLGHTAGDELLVRIAERLRAALRPGDVIARHGGDEFTVLLGGTPPDPRAIGDRLLVSLSHPVEEEGHLVPIGASIGLAMEQPGDDVDALLKRADEAMYRAKTAGRGCVST